MEMKMLIICPCGTKLRVTLAQYLQMRCPKCMTMLAQEIERQAARNSAAIFEITAVMLHERMNAKKWSVNDEKIARLLAKHEIVSHGGQWPPPEPPPADDVVFKIDLENGAPLLHKDATPSPLRPNTIRIKVKKTKKTKREMKMKKRGDR